MGLARAGVEVRQCVFVLAGAVCVCGRLKLRVGDLWVAKQSQCIMMKRPREAQQTYHWLCNEDDKRLWLAWPLVVTKFRRIMVVTKFRRIITLRATARP